MIPLIGRTRTFTSNQRARRWCALGCLALCLGALYALGALVPFWLLSRPDEGVAFFPPAGLTLSVLALTPRRTWPLWLAAFAAAEFTVDVTHHERLALALGFALANTLEPFVGALVLAAAVHRRPGYRAGLVSYALGAVAAAPLVGAVVGATFATLVPPARGNWWATAATWWVGDALGVLVVGSAILAWARPSPREDRISLTNIVTLAALAAGAIVASAVAWSHPMIYVVSPVLVWAAFTGGSRAVTTVGAVAALTVDWAALTGRAGRLLVSGRPEHQLVFLQLFLAVTVATGMVLAAEIAERRRNERLILRAEADRVRSEEATIKAVTAERHSITQDTHDIVGHGLNVMLLQLGAARRVVRSDPDLACELLGSIEAIGRGACQDLEVALALFGNEPELSPGRGLDALPDLIAGVRAAGLDVELRMEGERREVSPIVEWSAYRIVQEALTNVARHAPAASARVTVRFNEDDLYLSVVNDGRGSAGSVPSRHGRGLVGIRERATALGGSVRAGPRAPGGFRVVARLPRLRADTGARRPASRPLPQAVSAPPGPPPPATSASP